VYFESLSQALHMAGHGGYVWTVVALSALVITGLLLGPAAASRRTLTQLRSHAGQQQGGRQSEAAPAVRIEEVNNASGS
jgi:heme exporter protein CcmD